jgi:putative peptidoglycan lipid II flippase
VIAPAFYAVGRTRVAVIASIVAVTGNVVANILLHPSQGYRILALDTALAAVVNASILYVAFHRSIAPLPHRALLAHLSRIAAAAALMGAAVWSLRLALEHLVGTRGLLAHAVTALLPMLLGAVAYAAACAVLRVDELRRFTAKLRR